MSLALDLLEQAHHLSLRDSKKPKQASLRRAVSTAYYALFHLLTAEAAARVVPNALAQTRFAIQRWFDHTQMVRACSFFSAPSLTGAAHKLLPRPLSPDLLTVARAFVQMQELRHSADYDLSSTWNRVKAQQSIQLSRSAFAAWGRIRQTPEADLFLFALLDIKRLQTERG